MIFTTFPPLLPFISNLSSVVSSLYTILQSSLLSRSLPYPASILSFLSDITCFSFSFGSLDLSLILMLTTLYNIFHLFSSFLFSASLLSFLAPSFHINIHFPLSSSQIFPYLFYPLFVHSIISFPSVQ